MKEIIFILITMHKIQLSMNVQPASYANNPTG